MFFVGFIARPVGAAIFGHYGNLPSIIAGGPVPFIAAALFAKFQSGYAIAFYILILGCAVISIIATALLTDYTNRDISQEPADTLTAASRSGAGT